MLTIKQADYLTSAVNKGNWPDDNIVEFCFAGRSNVGKSSFLNTVTNRKNLARVSQNPGKTQLLNFFVINNGQFRFVDVPGYGFAKVSNQKKNQFATMMEEYFSERKNLKLVFLLLDFRHRPTADDILMCEYLVAKNIKVALIATKVDKVSKNSYIKNKKIILETLKLSLDTNLILFSSYQKIGINEVLTIFEEHINL